VNGEDAATPRASFLLRACGRCVQLPEPARCYHVTPVAYGRLERKQFYDQLSDKVARKQPFTALAAAFGGVRYDRCNTSVVLFGSPIVDDLQGSYKGLDDVLRTLREELQIEKTEQAQKSLRTAVDESAAADVGCNWVQCDLCSKWRTLPWSRHRLLAPRAVASDPLPALSLGSSTATRWKQRPFSAQTAAGGVETTSAATPRRTATTRPARESPAAPTQKSRSSRRGCSWTPSVSRTRCGIKPRC
jgi:hypothetical protein